jgi:hypothetical protein
MGGSGRTGYTAAPPGPPDRRAGADRIPLAVARVEHLSVRPARPFGDEDRVYFTDLMRSYGVECPEHLFDAARTSFTDLVEAILPRLRPYDDRFDLAVLAGVTPDCQPAFPMCRLGDAVPGAGLAFQIADQGVVAAFTALDVIGKSLLVDGGRRALLIVLDQSAFLHTRPLPERLRVTADSAAVLVLDEAGRLGSVAAPRAVPAGAADVAAALDAELRQAWPAAPDALVCGSGLVPHVPGGVRAGRVLPAPPGLPGTGVWAVLAAHLPRWRDGGARVVLADFDEEQGRLSTCAIEVAPAADTPAGAR